MKITVKAGGDRYTIEFGIHPGPSRSTTHLTAIAKSGDDLDKVHDYIRKSGASDKTLGTVIANEIEKKLKIPVEFDYNYDGAGFGLKFDLYSISKKLK